MRPMHIQVVEHVSRRRVSVVEGYGVFKLLIFFVRCTPRYFHKHVTFIGLSHTQIGFRPPCTNPFLTSFLPRTASQGIAFSHSLPLVLTRPYLGTGLQQCSLFINHNTLRLINFNCFHFLENYQPVCLIEISWFLFLFQSRGDYMLPCSELYTAMFISPVILFPSSTPMSLGVL